MIQQSSERTLKPRKPKKDLSSKYSIHYLTSLEAYIPSLTHWVRTGNAEVDARMERRQVGHLTVVDYEANKSLGSNNVSPNSKRTKLVVTNASKTRLALKTMVQCPPTAMDLPPQAASNSKQRSASALIVVKWATSKPTKSQSMMSLSARFANYPLIEWWFLRS
jgi:hypothetical protein